MFAKKIDTPLSENRILRQFTFIILYFSQGIPEGLTIFGIPAWLAMNGKSAGEIAGYSAMVMIPFSLKILIAPIMERYTYLPMGRRRPWLIFGQFGILCSLIALSMVPNPLENIFLLSIAAVCVHVFILFQDIATDSLVIDIVPLEQQGKANSLMWGSKTIGTSISLAVGSLLINQYGFPTAVISLAVVVLLIIFVPLLLRERAGEKRLPWSSGKTSPDAALLAVDSWGKLFQSFKTVVLLKNTLLLIVSLFITMASIHYMRTLLPIFTIQELGWTNIYYSRIYSTSSLIGGITGMLIGGFVIQRFGLTRMLQGALLLLAILVFIMSQSEALWDNNNFVIGFIACFCILLTLTTIGGLALAMHLCWKRISALQFTFCMTIFNLGLTSGAATLGYLRSFNEWQFIFTFFTGMVIIALIVIYFIKTDKHREQVELLEKNYVAILNEESSFMVKSETN